MESGSCYDYDGVGYGKYERGCEGEVDMDGGGGGWGEWLGVGMGRGRRCCLGVVWFRGRYDDLIVYKFTRSPRLPWSPFAMQPSLTYTHRS